MQAGAGDKTAHLRQKRLNAAPDKQQQDSPTLTDIHNGTHTGPPSARENGDPDAERLLSSHSASTAGPRSQYSALWTSAIFAEFVYCTISAGTTLFNKHALSSYNFPAPNSLLLFQFSLAVMLLQMLDVVGVITLQPLRMDLVKLWLPVNLIFVAMNVTGFYALQEIGVGEYTSQYQCLPYVQFRTHSSCLFS